GAVLAPHHAEDAEFGVTGLASEDADDLGVFFSGELVLGDQVGGDGHAGTAGACAISSEWNTIRPSLGPIRGSVARSGCGIIPITLRSRLSTPAMLRREPLALSM